MRVDIYRIPSCFFHLYMINFEIKAQGYIELNKSFDARECWELVNWGCHSNIKPYNLYSDIDHANDDVIFHNTLNGVYYLALPEGWKVFRKIDDLEKYCLDFKERQRKNIIKQKSEVLE